MADIGISGRIPLGGGIAKKGERSRKAFLMPRTRYRDLTVGKKRLTFQRMTRMYPATVEVLKEDLRDLCHGEEETGRIHKTLVRKRGRPGLFLNWEKCRRAYLIGAEKTPSMASGGGKKPRSGGRIGGSRSIVDA